MFRVRSWNNGVRCMSYYVLMNLWYDYIASWDISCPGGFCPESGPLSLGMQHHYFARYPTDEWHLANVYSLVYFSVVVCMRGLYHHILLATARALCQGQCTPHARFPLTEGGGLISGSPLLGRTGGVVELVLGSVFIIELDTGLAGIYFHRYYTEYDVCHKQNT